MPSQDITKRLMGQGRGLSCDEFVKMIEGLGPTRNELVSIQDLAVERGRSIRTLRRWNKLPDAPKRYRQGRREMYRRADVQHWFEQRARRKAPGPGARATDAQGRGRDDPISG